MANNFFKSQFLTPDEEEILSTETPEYTGMTGENEDELLTEDLKENLIDRDFTSSEQAFQPESDSGNDLFSKRQKLLEQYRALRPQNFEEQLSQAQDERRRQLGILAMLRGSNQIAQGMASQYGGKIGDASETVSSLEKIAGLPVEEIGEKQKVSEQKRKALGDELKLSQSVMMADPSSRVSDLYRKVARSRGLDVSDDMSAEDIDALMKDASKKSSSGKRYQMTRVTDPATGDVKLAYFDTETGEYTPADMLAGYSTQFRKDAFGNTIALSPSQLGQKPVQVSSSKRESVEKLSEEQKQQFRPDEKQVKALDDEQKRLDTVGKTSREQLQAANRINQLLDSDSKLTAAAIRTQMPRLMGEVGNLNETEQKVWEGSQAYIDQLEQWLAKRGSSVLTPENKKEFKKLITKFSGAVQNAAQSIQKGSLNKLQEVHAIPNEFSSKVLTVVPKVVIKKGYNPKTNQTQLIYSDGTKEIVEGRK